MRKRRGHRLPPAGYRPLNYTLTPRGRTPMQMRANSHLRPRSTLGNDDLRALIRGDLATYDLLPLELRLILADGERSITSYLPKGMIDDEKTTEEIKAFLSAIIHVEEKK